MDKRLMTALTFLAVGTVSTVAGLTAVKCCEKKGCKRCVPVRETAKQPVQPKQADRGTELPLPKDKCAVKVEKYPFLLFAHGSDTEVLQQEIQKLGGLFAEDFGWQTVFLRPIDDEHPVMYRGQEFVVLLDRPMCEFTYKDIQTLYEKGAKCVVIATSDAELVTADTYLPIFYDFKAEDIARFDTACTFLSLDFTGKAGVGSIWVQIDYADVHSRTLYPTAVNRPEYTRTVQEIYDLMKGLIGKCFTPYTDKEHKNLQIVNVVGEQSKEVKNTVVNQVIDKLCGVFPKKLSIGCYTTEGSTTEVNISQYAGEDVVILDVPKGHKFGAGLAYWITLTDVPDDAHRVIFILFETKEDLHHFYKLLYGIKGDRCLNYTINEDSMNCILDKGLTEDKPLSMITCGSVSYAAVQGHDWVIKKLYDMIIAHFWEKLVQKES